MCERCLTAEEVAALLNKIGAQQRELVQLHQQHVQCVKALEAWKRIAEEQRRALDDLTRRLLRGEPIDLQLITIH